MVTKYLLRLVPAVCVAAAITYSTSAIAQVEKVKVGVIGILAEAGLYVAHERGFFAKENIEVEFLKDTYGADAFPGLATGQIDAVGGAFGVELVNAVQRGINIRIAGGMSSYVKDFGSGFLMVRKELIDNGRVKNFSDLKGLRVALVEPKPNLTDYFASRYLKQGGITLADVTQTPIPFANMITALRTGGVDVAHVSEPLSSIIAGIGAAVKFKPVIEYAPDGLTVAVLHFGPSLLERRPGVGERLIAGFMQGARYYMDALKKPEGKDEMAQILMKHTPVRDRAVYDRIVWSQADPNATINMAGLQDMADYFGTHANTRRVEATSMVDQRFREGALRRLGTYQ
jgi:NitT/TauT family transport system substrate-binding protein